MDSQAPSLEDGRAVAVDAVANTLTSAVLRMQLALAQLTSEDLPPGARAAAHLLEGMPERLVQLGPELTRLAR